MEKNNCVISMSDFFKIWEEGVIKGVIKRPEESIETLKYLITEFRKDHSFGLHYFEDGSTSVSHLMLAIDLHCKEVIEYSPEDKDYYIPLLFMVSELYTNHLTRVLIEN